MTETEKEVLLATSTVVTCNNNKCSTNTCKKTVKTKSLNHDVKSKHVLVHDNLSSNILKLFSKVLLSVLDLWRSNELQQTNFFSSCCTNKIHRSQTFEFMQKKTKKNYSFGIAILNNFPTLSNPFCKCSMYLVQNTRDYSL